MTQLELNTIQQTIVDTINKTMIDKYDDLIRAIIMEINDKNIPWASKKEIEETERLLADKEGREIVKTKYVEFDILKGSDE